MAIINTHLLGNLKARVNIIPSCQDYQALLDYCVLMTGKNRYELFENQGSATYAQWADYLGIES